MQCTAKTVASPHQPAAVLLPWGSPGVYWICTFGVTVWKSCEGSHVHFEGTADKRRERSGSEEQLSVILQTAGEARSYFPTSPTASCRNLSRKESTFTNAPQRLRRSCQETRYLYCCQLTTTRC